MNLIISKINRKYPNNHFLLPNFFFILVILVGYVHLMFVEFFIRIMLEFCMTHMPPLFGAVEDAAFGVKQKVGYQYSTMPRVIHEAEKVRDRKTINIMLFWKYSK